MLEGQVGDISDPGVQEHRMDGTEGLIVLLRVKQKAECSGTGDHIWYI